ncbi:hypothetical protein QYE76_061943 [Lolium multiflorum]|uniref:Transposase (putative) gypsy type domain-containing protein n=1 Tax=Lolium multiflorum TaxID=4521 RepID=A0AAD8S333_LOLMU|nr:hypothetical protein QYE76_061943 [Lolium multiflorum]
MEASSSSPEATGRGHEASSSGQGSGANLTAPTRGAWKGSDVKQPEVDWLYRSRRILAQVSCRIPGNELEPAPEPGEAVVFNAHFERGFGLSASNFFRQFLDFYKLQPHHLLGNAIFYLSCFFSFMEAYIGLLPTIEAFAHFFCLRINSVQGKDIPKPKPPTQCGSCIISARQGSPFFKFFGLESCREWQQTFLYVKNKGAIDFINLPAYNTGTPSKANWKHNPGNTHIETNRIVRFMEQLMKDTSIFSDDIIRVFISRRACERFPRIAAEARGPGRKRPLDEVDPDPYVVGNKHKMGRTHTSRPGNFSTNDSDLPSASANPQVVEHAAPLQAEVGREFLDNLASQGRKHKAPASEAGPSEAPPAKRSKKGDAGKKGTIQHYRSRMPVASGPALTIWKSASGMRPETSEDAARASPPPQTSPVPSGAGKSPASPRGGNTSTGRAAPKSTDHRVEEDLTSPPEAEDTGASNTGADTEEAGRAEPLGTPGAATTSKEAAPTPPAAPTGQTAAAKPTPLEGGKLTAQQLAAVVTAATSPYSGSRSLMLHASRAAIAAGETASAQLGRITELNRGGADLGHLLDYAEKWNQADLPPATRGLGKDKLPVVDPAGPRIRRAIREFDTAWHDANANVVGTLDTRKQLFEELLWEHRFLGDAHSKCQSFPEASLEGLSAQLSALKAEKEQLALEHRKALDAQQAITAALKDQLMEAELWHARELKEAQSAAEAKLDESLKEYTTATTMLRTELEEETVGRKAAQDWIATLNTD